MEKETNKRTDMTQDQLNFDILFSIREKLEGHAIILQVLVGLIAIADEEISEVPHLGYGLAGLIDLWLKKQGGFTDESLKEIRESPGYVIQHAHEIMSLIQQGRKPSAVGGFEDIVERLEKTIKTYGDMYRAEADSLLKPLKEIREKGGFKN